MPLRTLKHTGTLLLLSLAVQNANAAFTPTPGDDVYVCHTGCTEPSLTDIGGNNSLMFPAGSAGAISGNVTFGAGRDSLIMNGGSVGGAVQMGSGIDYTQINGGTIKSLAQGDGLDNFLMTGGTITGAFEDGDIAKQTGGSIGRVDMKLDDNTYDLSGGAIKGNLVTGFGKDTIIVSGGSIGGNISVSGGNDSVSVSGGDIGGNILMSFGDDRFNWKDGGAIHGAVQLADGNDTAVVTHLPANLLSQPTSIDGGPGTDTLTFDNSKPARGATYVNWESIALTHKSEMTLNDSLVLGDSVSGKGMFSIDSTSTLRSAKGQVVPIDAAQKAIVANNGVIDLTGNSAKGRFTVVGDYQGNGRLKVGSVLAGDGADSDKLVVSKGMLSGSTVIEVNNFKGLGALTAQNGIQVVEANQGASSSNGAFTLGKPLSVGAYQYYLFKGGVTAGSENSWYLRSSVVAPPAVTPLPPTPPTPQPVAPVPAPAVSAPVAAVGTPALPVPVAGQSIALYRAEVPVYSAAAPAAATLGRAMLGTFHQRQGEQRLLTESGYAKAGWARVYGENVDQKLGGTVSPTFNGSVSGAQVGHDIWSSDSQRMGLYVGKSRIRGDVKGFALGFEDNPVGDLKLLGDSVGAYWTRISKSGAYVDLVGQYTRLNGRGRSDRGLQLDLDGQVVSVSVEAGVPFALNEQWDLEPQAQVIAQRVSLDNTNDGISHIDFDNDPTFTGRVGARLRGNFNAGGLPVTPWVRTNLWRTFNATDSVTYDRMDRVDTEQSATWLNVDTGVSIDLAPAVSVYTSVSYGANTDSNSQKYLAGDLGIRLRW
ncbi:autotransporter outer membrane beta-barrel domain-containing protein [Pseudomonas sp. R5(2019)]|uniref:autotransporter family protein n=1 Tax=Pseudomonas sp. R5(2019) TaxID=2697566 RepID=UPI002115086D|nr:autotransporter outer membrane beta-barrel domain-containing protein [Pseudomonas sp. R5(2019)]